MTLSLAWLVFVLGRASVLCHYLLGERRRWVDWFVRKEADLSGELRAMTCSNELLHCPRFSAGGVFRASVGSTADCVFFVQ